MDFRFSRAVAASCGVLALAAASGAARADSSGMDWLGVAYLWGADISADAGDRGADLSFSDILDKLEMGFMGHVEAQGDGFGGFVDVVYMSISDSASRPLADFRADLDMTLMDVALVWSPAEGRYTDGIDVFGGFRYLQTDFGLRVEPAPQPQPPIQVGVDTSYTDFLLGGRYAVSVNDNWRLMFSGDLSGGDTEGTWSLGGYGIYRNGPHRFYAGYRHLEAEVETGAGESADMSFSGPVLGYGFAF